MYKGRVLTSLLSELNFDLSQQSVDVQWELLRMAFSGVLGSFSFHSYHIGL